MIHAVIHSLNEWIHDEWTFNYEDRIFTTPVISPPSSRRPSRARVVPRARCQGDPRPSAPVPGYRGSRSPGYPSSTLLKRVEESGILVAMHASDSGYSRYQGDWTGPSEIPVPARCVPHDGRKGPSIMNTMTALACHGLFTRFPNLKIAAVENGGDWVPGFLKHLGDTHKKMPQMFEEDPVEAFKRKSG